MLKMYDGSIDDYREVTQADVDWMQKLIQELGQFRMAVRELANERLSSVTNAH